MAESEKTDEPQGPKRPWFISAPFEDYSVNVQMKRGILQSGTRLKVVRMREPTVEDSIRAQKHKSREDGEVEMLANLTEIAPDDLRKASLADYARLQAALDFLSE